LVVSSLLVSSLVVSSLLVSSLVVSSLVVSPEPDFKLILAKSNFFNLNFPCSHSFSFGSESEPLAAEVEEAAKVPFVSLPALEPDAEGSEALLKVVDSTSSISSISISKVAASTLPLAEIFNLSLIFSSVILPDGKNRIHSTSF